jgi:hypothetical protein
LLDDLAQGLQLAEVLPGHPIPPSRQGNGVDTGEHGEWRAGIILEVKPLPRPPRHRFGHGDVEIRVDATPPNCQFHIWVLWTLDMEEIVPSVEMGVNPHIGLAKSQK